MSENERPASDQSEQREAPKIPLAPTFSAQTTVGRQAFRDVKRGLSDEELASPGTQKLLLDMLETAQAERDENKKYIEKFHAADKSSGVLEEN